jgi:hypothetical protein
MSFNLISCAVVSFCSSEEIHRFLFQFVVFLNGVLCFSSKNTILMQQAVSSCIQLVRIQWRLSRQFILIKTESFFDVITNWVDAVNELIVKD